MYISPLIFVFGNIAIYIRIKWQDAQHAFFPGEKSLIQMQEANKMFQNSE